MYNFFSLLQIHCFWRFSTGQKRYILKQAKLETKSTQEEPTIKKKIEKITFKSRKYFFIKWIYIPHNIPLLFPFYGDALLSWRDNFHCLRGWGRGKAFPWVLTIRVLLWASQSGLCHSPTTQLPSPLRVKSQFSKSYFFDSPANETSRKTTVPQRYIYIFFF